jgi:glucose-6-phosphate 1-epimerase
MSSLQDLNQQFALSDSLVFAEHSSGLLIGIVQTHRCSAQFFLQGAHITHYQPSHAPQPILFTSEAALFEPNRPIRGGIPICFPWFSAHPTDPSLPAHGWARTSSWQVTSTRQAPEHVEVTLTLNHGHWHLNYDLKFGSTLQVALAVTNQATDTCFFELALHTYFNIGAVQQVQITGDLAHLPFLDQLAAITHPPHPFPIAFNAETDRIYQGTARNIQIHDLANHRLITLHSQNSHSTIVWNPWIAKSIRMPDFGDQEYLRMCCIETANVRQNGISIAPNDTHVTSLEIAVASQT